MGARLECERFVHAKGIGIEREDARSLVGKEGGNRRIERVTRPLADDAGGGLITAQHALEGGVASDVDDAHGQRDLVLLRPTGLALAVPALGDVAEQRPDGSRDPEPVGQHPRHLAEAGEVFLEHQRHPWKAVRELPCAHERRAVRRGNRAEEPGDHLHARAEPRRRRVPRQRVIGTEDLGGDSASAVQPT